MMMMMMKSAKVLLFCPPHAETRVLFDETGRVQFFGLDLSLQARSAFRSSEVEAS